MVPELGSFAIVIALCFAFLQGLAPAFGYYKKEPFYFQLSHLAATGQFIFLIFAMTCLIASFVGNDLSVVFVREHSHHLLPLLYRIGAAWGGHEGSLLLWCLILGGWTLLFTLFVDKRLSQNVIAHTVMTLGWLSVGFLLFLWCTSNPFKRDFPSALIQGDDLTPVLQDPGLIFHPPMLYLGYVGFAIAFAFAIAALIEGKFTRELARACRPWVILPWGFLGMGIVLGSWWAYRELGWGGWWFWDPVENASLLPWLSATALIHSLIVTEKRGAFQGWTLLLALMTFALSLLGTFLVRSGVLVSVHAFASDPTRGLFLLSYLALIICGSFILYGARIKHFYKPPQFHILSRETLLLMNSVFMITAVVTIVMGTIYPLILDGFNLGKISIGEPYFNLVFVPIMLPLLFLMGLASYVKWGDQPAKPLLKAVKYELLLSAIFAVAVSKLLGDAMHLATFLGLFFSSWVMLATIAPVIKTWRAKQSIPFGHWAMIVSHLGIAIFALGVTLNKSYSEEKQIKIFRGETVKFAGSEIYFDSVNETKGPNYRSMTAFFSIKTGTAAPQKLEAQQRIYTSHDQFLAKPGILSDAWRDIYLALGTGLPDGAWSVRLYYKPCVRWIWFGGFMLLIGGGLSVINYLRKRYSHVAD